MWFTWLSTILYDVRFVADSVYNRICKLIHFGVMAGFVSIPLYCSACTSLLVVKASSSPDIRRQQDLASWSIG
jgi:hypothetical protein